MTFFTVMGIICHVSIFRILCGTTAEAWVSGALLVRPAGRTIGLFMINVNKV